MGKLSRGALPLRIVAASAAAVAFGLVAPQPLGIAPAAAATAAPFDGEIADFYRARGGAPLWFAPRSGAAAQQLVQLLASAQADRLNPRRYNVRGLERAIADARSGNPAAIRRAEAMLSGAFVSFARDQRHDPGVGIIYVDPELKPTPPSPGALLNAAAHAPSLGDYVQQMGWMNPMYAKLRQAIASRLYRSDAERRLLQLNLERARALPAGNGPYVIVNPPAAPLYM
jgi:murein L,D-transpeptidase YcbB/YkuD